MSGTSVNGAKPIDSQISKQKQIRNGEGVSGRKLKPMANSEMIEIMRS